MNKTLGVKARRFISLLTLLLMASVWQVASVLYPAEIVVGEPMVPGWHELFSNTFLRFADYWDGGFGVAGVISGAERSYAAAFLALAVHSFDTLIRLGCGLFLGIAVGCGLGFLSAWSPWGRRVVNGPVGVLRTLPLLAMVPLFQLWFGVGLVGQIIFVAYGVGVIVYTATVNAIANISETVLDNAWCLGAGKLFIFRTIVVPGIVPEMRSAVMLALGMGWAAVLGAEYLGAQSGLGYIIVYAEQFGYLDRMFLVALLLIVYVALTAFFLEKLFDRLTVWMPRSKG